MEVTRGWGLLEKRLAQLRAAKANSLIDSGLRTGRILDIGCGHTPFFLMQTEFAEKVGCEQTAPNVGPEERISVLVHDVARKDFLPFQNNTFEAVTMLAVFEHLDPQSVANLLEEVHRVLKPGGTFVMTTPPPWTDRLLKVMSKIKLVSPAEIEEHKKTYTRRRLTQLLNESPFGVAVSVGFFEAGMNLWAKARKGS